MATEQVSAQFEGLGLKLSNLVIENISFPEEVEKALDTKASMGVLKDSMDTYVKFKSAEAIGDAAKNPGVAGLGSQLGTGMALGEMIKDSMKSSTKATEEDNSKGKFCPECGAKNSTRAKFCCECGYKLGAAGNVCPNCGEKAEKGAKFCHGCGTKLK